MRKLISLLIAVLVGGVVGLVLTALPATAATNTIVSFTFDDGQATQYPTSNALAAHGMRGTYYINSGLVGSDSFYMTWPQIQQVAAAGHEIGGHTLTHTDLTTASSSTAQREVCDDRTNLQNQGFSPVVSFAYPYAASNSAAEQLVKSCGYSSARTVGDINSTTVCTGCPYAESIPPVNPYRVRTPEPSGSTVTLADLQRYVTNAETHGGGWVTLVFHGFCSTGCSGDSTNTAMFNSFLDWLQPRSSLGTQVKTVGDVMSGGTTPPPPPPAPGAPTTAISCNGSTCSTGWSRAPVSVGLQASPAGSTTKYTTDGTDPRTSSSATTYASPFTVSRTTTLWYSSSNADGVETPKSTIISIDSTAPTTAISCNGGVCNSTPYSTPVSVSLVAADEVGGSGVASTRYTVDGSDPTTSPTARPYTAAFPVSQTTTLRAFSTDVAGNVEPSKTQLVQVAAQPAPNGALTLTPTDDSYTAKGNPTATHGSETSLNVNSGTERRSYLQFNVAGIPAGATGVTATLRLYSQSGAPSTVSFPVSQVTTGWTESSLVWNNQPALGRTLSTRPGLSNGAYNAFDLSNLVTGDGTVAVAITSTNSTQRFFSSKEATAAQRPQLVLSWTNPN
ncbi:MAG: hypothetical protein QOG60_2593 [Frankiaceae bacterium]|nr:hypothetical protein [Frankiaceae bacterium]